MNALVWNGGRREMIGSSADTARSRAAAFQPAWPAAALNSLPVERTTASPTGLRSAS